MGYPMARNLRAGLDKGRKLIVCDVSKEAIDKFQKETEGQGPVEVASNGAECVKTAVCDYGLVNINSASLTRNRTP